MPDTAYPEVNKFSVDNRAIVNLISTMNSTSPKSHVMKMSHEAICGCVIQQFWDISLYPQLQSQASTHKITGTSMSVSILSPEQFSPAPDPIHHAKSR
jgi:hypothetical protein